MSAPHLLAQDVSTERIEITGEDARHAVRVLRLRVGERVQISDGRGAVVDAVVTAAERTLIAEVQGRRSVPRPSPRITVVQAIPKGSKLDQIVQDLTELGVDEIIPLRAERSVARWDDEGRKLTRLRTIAREASKQSHRAWLPDVTEVRDVAAAEVGQNTFILHEEASDPLVTTLPEDAEHLSLWIGPEGGFDPDEVRVLADRGARAVTLGSAILRTETAAVVAATLVLARFGRLG